MLKYNRWIRGVLLFSFILIFMYTGTIFAQSSANYKIPKSVLDQGGAPSQSTNYKLIEAIGQPSPVAVASSANYMVKSGFFAGGTVAPPTLLVSPTTLDFGPTQTSLTFQISNTGGGTLTWTVAESPDKPWITSVSPASGNGNATVTVTVDRSLLSGNSDTGTLAVTSNGGNQNVTVLISRDVPVLSVVPTTLDFGATPTSMTFQISNTGSGTLIWTVTESPDKPWITSVSPANGNGNATVTVTVVRSLLSGNSDTGTLVVNSNGGVQNVAVLISKDVPVLSVVPTTLDFGPAQTSMIIQVSNTGSGTLVWTVTESPDKPWITSVSPANGNGNATVTVTVDRSLLSGNSDTGTLVVNSNGGIQNVTVAISRDVPVLGVVPTTLDFGPAQTSLTFQVNNTGNGTLTWTVTENPEKPWITSVTPATGTNNQTVTVHVSRTGLSPGSYTGQLSVTSNGGNVDVNVKMTVAAPPETTVKIDPPTKDIGVNSTGTTDVVIEKATNLGSFEFTISYNKDIVQIVNVSDVVLGAFLGSTGRTVIPLGPDIDNNIGKIVFGGASLGAAAGPTGNGVLATITWKALSEGTTTLDLNTVKVSDILGVEIPKNEVDGQIEVTECFWADVDCDGDVDIIDIQLVAARWNTQVGDPEYAPNYDVDNEGQGDGDIDIIDIQLVASWWNKLTAQESVLSKQIQPGNSNDLSLNYLTIFEDEVHILEITVENAVDLAGFQFDLIATPGVDIQSVQLGDFLVKTGNQASVLGPKTTDSGDRMVVGAFSYGSNSGASGSGKLVRIAFAGEPGSISLENFKFADHHGNPISQAYGNFELGQTLAFERLPEDFALEQNYPNPFNPETEIKYQIAHAGQVVLKVYNLVGKEIRTLVNEEQNAGYYQAGWDGRNDMGEKVASGIYIYRLATGYFTQSKKMTLLK